ncbi:MAG TPA: phosphatase, partial [Gammaproteobacteria bacterium]|nr:phosphatase [Gammaproteobacteria bacterium]
MHWKRLRARVVYVPSLMWNIMLARCLRHRDWWNRVDQHVLLGALPFPRDVEKLSSEGVSAVVNTCQEYAGPVSAYKNFGIRQLRIPTIDFTPPALQDIELAVAFMNRHIADGKTVYVHCKAGRGRSATVVMCWLIQDRQISASDAQQWIRKFRPHINDLVNR